jgi:hypothetical protein
MRAASSAKFGIRIAWATALAITCSVFAPACGSRGPLDDEGIPDAAAADVAAADVSVPDPVDATPADAGREAAPTPIDCGICLLGQCSQDIIACIASPGCREAFQCVITDCAGLGGGGGGGGGGFDPVCLFKCASSDPAGALQVLQIFQCVTGQCGEDCGALLGGLLGGGLGGGGFPGGGSSGGGSSGGGGKQYTPAQRQFAKAFSRWPELCGPIAD